MRFRDGIVKKGDGCETFHVNEYRNRLTSTEQGGGENRKKHQFEWCRNKKIIQKGYLRNVDIMTRVKEQEQESRTRILESTEY